MRNAWGATNAFLPANASGEPGGNEQRCVKDCSRSGSLYCNAAVVLIPAGMMRDYNDDTEAFFRSLEKGKKISLIVCARHFWRIIPGYGRILGYLKQKGVNHIYSVSFGADITTWGYLRYITEL